MNDLMERYLTAVCSYFFGKKRDYVYQDLKVQILNALDNYEDIESLLVSFGHPKSMAYNYGYKPLYSRTLNPSLIHLFEKIFFSVSFLYLLLSTLYYLQQLNYITIIPTHISALSLITWVLSNPIIVLSGVTLLSIIIFFVCDRKYPVSQSVDLEWNEDKLENLPHPSHYPNHISEVRVLILFSLFFFIYSMVFSSEIILIIQHSSFEMIHVMANFFQPFMMMTLLIYLLDMTKKKYSKKYLKYSIFMSLVTLLALSVFVFNGQFLDNYLLPLNNNLSYLTIDTFIITAIIVLYLSSLYKFIKNLKAYRFLFKK